MGHINTSIDRLIKIVERGGSVKTGIDIYNSKKIKTIEKTSVIKDADILHKLKEEGVQVLPISPKLGGGTWDKGRHTDEAYAGRVGPHLLPAHPFLNCSVCRPCLSCLKLIKK